MVLIEELTYDIPDSARLYPDRRRRSDVSLMVVDRKSGRIQHQHFTDLPRFLGSTPCYANRAKYAGTCNEPWDFNEPLYCDGQDTWFVPSAGIPIDEDLMVKLNLKFLELWTPRMRPNSNELYKQGKSNLESYSIPVLDFGPVCAIGTTSAKALESAAHQRNLEGESDLLIQPGYIFGKVNALLTCFHFPKETMLALTCAFGGTDLVLGACEKAMKAGYKVSDRGDRMLII